MALSVVYGVAPYDRPFRLPQLSGGFYGDHLVYIGAGQATDGTTTHSFSGGWFDVSGMVQWVPQGQLSWVSFGVGTSLPSGASSVVSGDGQGMVVFCEPVASSSVTKGDIPLCVVGIDVVNRIAQMIDKRGF